MKSRDGALSLATRKRLAQEAFKQTAQYDMMVSSYLAATEQPSPFSGGRSACGIVWPEGE